MTTWLRVTSAMTSMACAILFVFCCVSSVLTGEWGGQGFPTLVGYRERGRGATYFSNLALLGTFVTGSIAVVKSDARMGRAAAGLFASSLLVPLVVVYIPHRIKTAPDREKEKIWRAKNDAKNKAWTVAYEAEKKAAEARKTPEMRAKEDEDRRRRLAELAAKSQEYEKENQKRVKFVEEEMRKYDAAQKRRP